MGQSIAKSLNPPPLSLVDCIVDGKLDLIRYYHIRRILDEQEEEFQFNMTTFFKKKRKIESIDSICSVKEQKHRSVKKHKLYSRMPDGNLRELVPEDTIWYHLYVANPPQNERMMVLFRNRFRIPYSYFLDLSKELIKNELFQRWSCCDASGLPPSNFKLLLLGSLRYIGRGWTFDDVSEANGISREVNRQFFWLSLNMDLLNYIKSM